MTLLRVVTSAEFVEQVRDALVQAGIIGMTVTDLRGAARGGRERVHYRGTGFTVGFVPRVELELVMPDAQVADAVNEIMEVARTDRLGENRICLIPVEQSYRIRTGEREFDDDVHYWV